MLHTTTRVLLLAALIVLPAAAQTALSPDLPSGTIRLTGLAPTPQPGTASSAQADARASLVSPVIESSVPFSLAGPFWRAGGDGAPVHIELRASRDGVDWSEWVATGHHERIEAEGGLAEGGWSADPVLFAPGNRFLQIRASSDAPGEPLRIDDLAIYHVDATPGPDLPDPAEEQRFAEQRQAFEWGASQSAAASVPAPRIYTRSEWGARSPRSSWRYATAGRLAIHHSASTSDGRATTWSACAAAVRGIQNFHMNVNGWSDVGYNYLVCPTGDLFQGREDNNNSTDVVGAHDTHNTGSVGVNGLGYYHPPYNQQPSQAMLNGFADLFAWIADRRGIDPSGSSFYPAYGRTTENVYGHRQVRATACPGDGLFARKADIIARTEDRMAGQATGLAARWQRSGASGGRPAWFSSTANTERGLAYARAGSQDRLYVVSRSGGTAVRVLNAATGADVGTLSTSGIGGGTFALNDIESSSDGVLFAANLTTNTLSSRFRVYRWDSEASAPVRVINFRTWSTPMRLGDHITVTGSASDNSLTLYAPTSGGDYVVVFTTTDGGYSFSYRFVNVSSGGTLGQNPSVAPFASDFYVASRGLGAQQHSQQGTRTGTVPSAAIPTTVGSAKAFASYGGATRKYLAAFDFKSAANHGGFLRVADVTSGAASAQPVAVTPWLGGSSNPNGAGDVAVKSNGDGTFDLFVLSTNNGLAAYRMGSGSSLRAAPDEPQSLPERFVLTGNRPNPASATTLVSYDLPGDADVTLEVYDLLGRQVAAQPAAFETAGTRTRHVDVSGLPSGVYVVRVQAGGEQATHRITVVN